MADPEKNCSVPRGALLPALSDLYAETFGHLSGTHLSLERNCKGDFFLFIFVFPLDVLGREVGDA